MSDFETMTRGPVSESTFDPNDITENMTAMVGLPMGKSPTKGTVPSTGGVTSEAADPALAALVTQLIQLAYTDIADWVKSWMGSSTTHSSVSDIVMPVGERLVFKFISADDEAFIVFNDEKIASKNRGEGVTTHVSSSTVKEGLNLLTIGVDNRGRMDWYVVVEVFEERSRRPHGRIAFKGNDGIFDNFHFISGRIWGR